MHFFFAVSTVHVILLFLWQIYGIMFSKY